MKELYDFLKRHDIFNTALIILIMVFIRTTVLGNYTVDTGSMNPTIMEGDKFFSNNIAYSLKVPFTDYDIIRWDTPSRGDIIAFRYPGDESINYTKRVIGLPGDEIEIRNKVLFINGKMVQRELVSGANGIRYYHESLGSLQYTIQQYDHYSAKDNMMKLVIPRDTLFVMGDNRDNSFDSRYWGFVPMKNVLGRLVYRWISIDPETWAPRWERTGGLYTESPTVRPPR